MRLGGGWGASWERLGAVLGGSWGRLGPSWNVLGASRRRLGMSWGPVGPSWGAMLLASNHFFEACHLVSVFLLICG